MPLHLKLLLCTAFWLLQVPETAAEWRQQATAVQQQASNRTAQDTVAPWADYTLGILGLAVAFFALASPLVFWLSGLAAWAGASYLALPLHWLMTFILLLGNIRQEDAYISFSLSSGSISALLVPIVALLHLLLGLSGKGGIFTILGISSLLLLGLIYLYAALRMPRKSF